MKDEKFARSYEAGGRVGVGREREKIFPSSGKCRDMKMQEDKWAGSCHYKLFQLIGG